MGVTPTRVLRLGEAAPRMGISTAELVKLVYERKIDYVLVGRAPHIAEDVIERYRRNGRAS